tara:strand:+ start:22 stop:468 length:447 start_codon:yes stop_codon:yes gene_type:complete
MATLNTTLTLSSSDAFATKTLNHSVTDALTVEAPLADISTMNTNDNIGNGVGIILAESTSTDTYFVYIKHTGKLASDGTTASHASNDFVRVTNADGDTDFIKLQPEEFAFFPLNPFDGSDGGVEPGGLKVESGSANEVRIEFAYFKRS